MHETAESIHRPLMLSAMVITNEERNSPLVLICADMSYWSSHDAQPRFFARLLEGLSLEPENLIFALSHSHAAPPLIDVDPSLPGGDLLQQWIDSIPEIAIAMVQQAQANAFDGLIEWQTGRCGLATVRDFQDPTPGKDRFLCGYAPGKPADDTLLVGRVTDQRGVVQGVLVNYACHPTTLAWQNKSVSPDYIGAMRETIEAATHAPVFFLLGACGELAPRNQYTADTDVADGHGRQLGYAVLSTLSGMEAPGKKLTFTGVMESGAPLAIWSATPDSAASNLDAMQIEVDIPLKDWPTADELEQQRLASNDPFQKERLKRKRAIRLILGDGATYRLPLTFWRIGDAVFVGSRCEAYSLFQVELRLRFSGTTLICLNLINGSMGYLPPAEQYSLDIYPVWQTPFAAGCLELTLDAAHHGIEEILAR